MNKRYFFTMLTVLTVVIFGCSSSKPATEEGRERWVTLGSSRVDYKMDRDVIRVDSRNAFSQLKFGVQGGAINMHRATIHFENGSTQEVNLRDNFRRGSASRVIDLQGNRRRIDRISVWYDTKQRSRKKAELIVYGK
ncbi:MAG: hypothetical protein ACTHMC_26340 [Pseudobacter sp.]|uniref:hypothetical protein n=1 Tax=Pseudobacter sp. TaxID=2045420 RepID=UPI003F7F0062